MATTDDTSEEPNESENSHKQCDRCEEFVTRAYHRVFSDNDGVLHGCINCSPMGMGRGGNR